MLTGSEFQGIIFHYRYQLLAGSKFQGIIWVIVLQQMVRIDLMFSYYSHDHIVLDTMNIMANGHYIDRFMA